MVDELPTDLHKAYEAFSSKVDPLSPAPSAKLLRIGLASHHWQRELSALAMWSAMQEDDELIFKTYVCPISEAELKHHVE